MKKVRRLIIYHDTRPCHFFTCAAPTCKLCAGGVRRFQDSKDKSSTANLKHYTIHCFGEDAVNAAISGKAASERNGSLVKYSHHVHTNPELQYVLLFTGRPNVTLPSNQTISRDINTSFEKCWVHIAKLLQEHPGRIHFGTDAWTATNHCAFVAWTAHIEYEGIMLAFLLDIVEVPEVSQ
ncbi:hypothetical protein C8R48DRAFT_745625 [Suillus tomentosus]|nr:hypothetical protein C8R48DRAFT_745625 [Suillus tomentosus]